MLLVLRRLLSLVALVAIVAGTPRAMCCLEDDECAVSWAVGAMLSCPASEEHHDPTAPIPRCHCLCHAPGVAADPAIHLERNPPVEDMVATIPDRLTPGFLEPPLRPPRA